MNSPKSYRMLAVLFSTLVVTTCPSWAELQIVDLYDSFPDNQGDNGFSAYGYAAATDTYSPLSDGGPYHFYRPEEGSWGNPHVFKDGYYVNWMGEGWIGLMPSGTASNPGYPEDATLAWAIPAGTTSYELMGTFYDYPGSENGVDVYIKHNNTVLWSSHLLAGEAIGFDVTSPMVNPGDILYFSVGAHHDRYFSELNDWGFLNARINVTPVPVPSAVLLGMLGLVTAGLRLRKCC
jgi:hypothetical protein